MASNAPNMSVKVQCSDTGVGHIHVKGSAPSEINMVRLIGNFGYPSVQPAERPEDCIIQVLGALPDSTVVVEFHTLRPDVDQTTLVETAPEPKPKTTSSKSKPAPSSD